MIGWARILYSERKHRKWGNDGAAAVRGFMVAAIQGVQWDIEQELAGGKAG